MIDDEKEDDKKERSDDQKDEDFMLYFKKRRENEVVNDEYSDAVSECIEKLKKEGQLESFEVFKQSLSNKKFADFLAKNEFKNNFLLSQKLGDFILELYNQRQEDSSKHITYEDLVTNLADEDDKIKLLGHDGKVFKIGLRANIGTVISQLYHEEPKQLKELRALGYLNNISATIKELKGIVDVASSETYKSPLEFLLAELRNNLEHNLAKINKSDKDQVKIIADIYVSLRNIERKLRDSKLDSWDPIKDDSKNWGKIPDVDNKNDTLIIKILKGILQVKNAIADFFDDYITGPEVDSKKLDAAIDSGDFSILEKLESAFKEKVSAVKPKNSP